MRGAISDAGQLLQKPLTKAKNSLIHGQAGGRTSIAMAPSPPRGYSQQRTLVFVSKKIGGIHESQRSGGRVTPIPSNDLWIAASCLEHSAVLFYLHARFERVPGLRVVRCWAEVLP